ncbi:MAG: DNA polymerase IV [Patescibacteria group bacterium]
MLQHIILHIDMDAFFASVEQRDEPRLKNKPVAVIGANTRTVIVTASYEARAQGVQTGMNIVEARRACPGLIFVRANHQKYTQACSEIVQILYSFSPDLEVYSIDESFLDIAGVRHLFGEPLEIGRKIKEQIWQKLKLSCSVGIAPNKLLAKLASSKNKPDGLFQIKEEDVKPLLKDLPVDELWGIGSQTAGVLNGMGIYTCSQLACADVLLLKKRFGIWGELLKEMGQGKGDSSVMPFGYEPRARSIGHSMTLAYDISSQDELLRYILELSDMVCRRMRREGFLGRTVRVIFRYNDFQTFSRQKRMQYASDDTGRIYFHSASIVKKIALARPVRLLGVSVSGLERNQQDLFLFEQDRRAKRLNKTLDSVNERFGDGILTFASLLSALKHDKVISPSWRPYGTRKY